VYWSTGRPKESEAALLKALALYQRLADAQPTVIALQIDLGRTYTNLGVLAVRTGKPQAALEFSAKVISLLKPLLGKRVYPKARGILRDAHSVRASALERLKRHREAVKDWDRALELAEGKAHTWLRIQRAYALVWAGDLKAATAQAEDLAREPKAAAGTVYDAACVFALAGASAQKDTKQVEDYARRAVALLREAVRKGYNKLDHIRRDSDLDSLRQRADFREVLKELEEKRSKQSK
jgi:tetratricopeptide (TPR) repeat protein